MKTLPYKFSYQVMLAAICIICTVACKKKVDSSFEPDRMFMPGDITVTSGETSAVLKWNASLFTAGKGAKYTVEISTDSTFQTSAAYTVVTDTTKVTVTDNQLSIKQKYFARVKANASASSDDSKWVYSSSFVPITGEQIFLPVLDAELKDKSVTLRWKSTTGLTKITLLPPSGPQIDIALDDADNTAALKQITGLTPSTLYTALIFAGAKVKGTITFTTKVPSIFTVILTPADNLVTAVANAAAGDVIGLNPGTYNCVDGTGVFVNLNVIQKSITIQSVSGIPSDTKVNFKEITLKGTGAGITLKGIEFDGAAATAAGTQALYFLNLVGLTTDAEAATFTNITLDNCLIQNIGNCILRGNRAANSAHKIGAIKLNNCRVYNSAIINTNYSFFQINKLEFTKLEIKNSTIRTIGRGFIDWDANITVSTAPEISIDQCTINNMGRDAYDYCLLDLNTNAATVNFKNSIIANIPMSGQTSGNNLMRCASATVTVSYCNTFNLTNGATPPVAYTFPGTVTLQNNKTIDLGWTSSTTDFALPANSELRTSSSSGSYIGDPRWAL